MQDSQNLKDLQIQLNKFISRLEELERENKYLKDQILNQQCQLMQNVKIIDTKYQQMHRKYLKCLYRYGISQSCLTSMISQYNKLICTEKMDLKQCIERFGVIYEKDKIINEEEMKNIIKQRISKDSEDIHTLFFPIKIYRNECLSENDSLQNTCIDIQYNNIIYTFQSLQSQRCKMQSSSQTNSELYTDNSEETIINNLTTQRYLEKLQFDYLNDQTLHYPKTFKVDRLLQQSNRDLNTQILTDRSMRIKQERRVESKMEQNNNYRVDVKGSPQKQLNSSINEDRMRRFDNNQENDVQYQRRRSRQERLKNELIFIYNQIFFYIKDQLMGVGVILIENVRENNSQLQDIVGWNEDGTGFLVKNVIGFQDQVLPMYFKHRNFASFVRQMNMYGFHKSRSDQKENEFIHPHFKKDQRNLLKKIKRKSGEHGDDQFTIMELKPHRNQNISDKQIQQIVTKQSELEKVCKILIEQNNKILQCNQQLRNQLVQERFNGNKKLQRLKDYFLGQQQIQGDCSQKRTFEDLIQSDNEEIMFPSLKKIKGEDSDSTIDKMEQLYGQPPLMLTNTLVENDGMIQLLDDHQFNDIYFD